MGEDSTRTEARNSATLPANLPSAVDMATSPTMDNQAPSSPPQDIDDPPLLIPSFSPGSTPSAPSSPGGTLARLGLTLKAPPSPSTSPTSPTSGGGQVSAITVVALLDKLVAMVESVQENQRRAEKRQAELEAAVRVVQGDVTRLAKNHNGTAGSVAKLLERSKKTGAHVKEVRDRLDRQGTQVKRLEANHAHLLKRNHFKVIIFQEDNEIPSTLQTKSPGSASLRDVQEDTALSPTVNPSHVEGLQTISLTSDDDDDDEAVAAGGAHLASPHGEPHGDDYDDDEEGLPSSPGLERLERSRAEKLKRSSLKKVDSLKKAFSRQSIEKKINKIVPPERREKIKKSFTPNHPKSPSAKSSTFHVSPMTFNVKKVRDGDAKGPTARVEVPSLGGPDGEIPLAEVHSPEDEKELPVLGSPTLDGMDAEVAVTGEMENGGVTVAVATLAEEETMPDHHEDDDEEDYDDEDNNDEHTNDHLNHEGEEKAHHVTLPTSPVNTAVVMQQSSS